MRIFKNSKQSNLSHMTAVKHSPEIDSSVAAETVVGHSVKLEGDLVAEGDIKVDGIVSGKVKTTKSLFVGPTAKIEADVQAGSITVAGVIRGNVKAADLLVILQTGNVTGDIVCSAIAIEEGAYFVGKCTMNEKKGNGKTSVPLPDEDE
jgi:cytoskeletal protein CcmA (bactofilin family)